MIKTQPTVNTVRDNNIIIMCNKSTLFGRIFVVEREREIQMFVHFFNTLYNMYKNYIIRFTFHRVHARYFYYIIPSAVCVNLSFRHV